MLREKELTAGPNLALLSSSVHLYTMWDGLSVCNYLGLAHLAVKMASMALASQSEVQTCVCSSGKLTSLCFMTTTPFEPAEMDRHVGSFAKSRCSTRATACQPGQEQMLKFILK